MNDDSRALLASVDVEELGSTLLFDLADPELIEAFPQATLRTTTASRDTNPEDPPPWAPAEQPFDTVVMAVPKSRARLRMLLALASSLAKEGSRLILVANNRGAGAATSDLAQVSEVEKLGSKAHRKVLSATVSGAAPFDLDSWASTDQIETPDGPMQITWLPGVFAEGHLDPGTALLLENLPPFARRVLDIGSGSGVISAFMAKRADASVVAVDNDVFAAEATRRTLALNGVKAEVLWANSLPDRPRDPDDRFDLVVSNPPFHEGLEKSTVATERLIKEAAAAMHIRGEIRIVANRFLRYDRILIEVFGSCDLLAEDAKYRIWRAAR